MVCKTDERAIPAEKGGSTIMRPLPYPHSPFSSYQLQLNAQLGQIYHTLIKFSVVEITDNPCLAPPFSKHIDTPDEEEKILGPVEYLIRKSQTQVYIHVNANVYTYMNFYVPFNRPPATGSGLGGAIYPHSPFPGHSEF